MVGAHHLSPSTHYLLMCWEVKGRSARQADAPLGATLLINISPDLLMPFFQAKQEALCFAGSWRRLMGVVFTDPEGIISSASAICLVLVNVFEGFAQVYCKCCLHLGWGEHCFRGRTRLFCFRWGGGGVGGHTSLYACVKLLRKNFFLSHTF